MRFAHPAPDVYTASTYLGPIRWFGTPFALASLMPLSGAVGLVEVQMEGGGEAPTMFLVLFALPFLCVGLGLMFWKREITLDFGKGTVSKRSGAFFPLSTRVRKLDAFAAAVHDKRIVRGDKSSHTVFPVILETPGGGGFELLHCRNKRDARQTAEWLARHGEFAIIDRTSGTDKRREFEDLDTSLRDRRKRDGGEHDPGNPPSKMRSKLTAQDGEITIEIPAHGMQPLIFVALAFATGPIWMGALFHMMATGDEPTPAFFLIGLYGICALPTVILSTITLYNALRRFILRVNHDELRVEERGLRNRTTVMPAEEIEDLHVPEGSGGLDGFLGGGPPITITSDQVELTIGQSLKRQESSYLAAVLRGALSA